MDTNSLKQKTISGMIWNAIQRFGTMFLSFATNIVLARMLMPEDFGAIGMLAIFISLSEVFIDGGFGSALIQKKKPTQDDYSTIFYWNLTISTLLFCVMQVVAPWIADFYHMPKLCNLLRVLSIVLIINGFTVIQTNILTKTLSFKLIAKIRLVATAIAMAVSIFAAYKGFGVWSLVLKDVLAATIGSIAFWFFNKWRPSFVFSLSSFKELFSFGGLMLLSSLMNSLFENLQGLVIGRFYTAKDLGLYSQAKKLDELPSKSISQVVTQVSFPVFSQVADNNELLVRTIRKNIICTTYLIFALQAFLIASATPLFVFIFSEKWVDAIPFFRILCVYSMFISLNAINTNIYKALGKSNIYFWVQFIKKLVSLGFLFVGLQFGVIGVTWSVSISGIIWWIFSASVNIRVVGYGLFSQIKDIALQFLLSAIIGLMTWIIISSMPEVPLLQLFTGLLLFVCSYIGVSILFKLEGFDVIYKEVLKKYLKRNR